MKNVVDRFSHQYNTTLQTTIQNFIASQARLQGVTNPSGGLWDGQGLGEAKYMVDLTQFTGEWGMSCPHAFLSLVCCLTVLTGRPQRDGPPLRAIALINYAKWLVNNNYIDTAKTVLWPVIKNDLAYTAQYW